MLIRCNPLLIGSAFSGVQIDRFATVVSVLFSFLYLLIEPVTCRAVYELRLNDGVTLMWQHYTEDGSHYCTQKEFGSFCLDKKDVIFLREIKRRIEAVPPVLINRSPARDVVRTEVIGGVPVTGAELPGSDLFDNVMVAAMQKIGCSAAVLAVAERGTIVYSRGYGWLDRDKNIPTPPDALIGIASCEKPVTAAAIKHLAQRGMLDLNAHLFEQLKIKPRGSVIDDRMRKITLAHVLEHKAGWGPDPASAATAELSRTGTTKEAPSIEALLSVIMTGHLKNTPGEVAEYCNFGYATLRLVLEKVSGRRPGDYFRDVLLQPGKVPGFQDADASLRTEAPPLVWNAASGGPISASAPSLLAFMHRYWLTGEPRDNGNPLWVMYGSLDGSTAIMVWRSDGIDLVALFNGRGNASHDEISRSLQTVIEQLQQRRGGSLRLP